MTGVVSAIIETASYAGFCRFSQTMPLLDELISYMRRRMFSTSISELVIKDVAEAKRNSLSAIHGSGRFPFHTDFAFRPIPPRFIVLLNSSNAHFKRPTYVSRFESLPKSLMETLRRSSWHLNSPGGQFILQTSFALGSDWGLRWDLDFLTPANPWAQKAREYAEKAMLNCSQLFDWAPSSALMIDNWRCVHARGSRSAHDNSDDHRKLTRIEFWRHAGMDI